MAVVLVLRVLTNDSKTFTLSATQYDFEVPTGTTNLRMFSDSGDDQSIILTPARGIAINKSRITRSIF